MRTLLFILVLVFSVSAQDRFAEASKFAVAGRYDKALISYRQVNVKDAESSARVHYNIGVCLYRLNRSAEAVSELRLAIALKGENYQRAWYALGMAQSAQNNTAEARAAFTRAVTLNKKDAEAWFDLGLVLIRERDLAAAREAFQKAIEYGSKSRADAHNNLGVIYALGGNIVAAVTEFEISGSAEAAGNLKFCREHGSEIAAGSSSMLKFGETGGK